MKEKHEIMKTHKWEIWGQNRYTKHFLCSACGVEGIANEANLHDPVPEFYNDIQNRNLTCNEIVVKNILT